MDKRKESGRWKRRIAIAAASLVCLWAIFCGAAYWAMTRPPEQFGAIVARTPMITMMVLPFETMWKRARGGKLAPGDPAPDFTLPTLDHKANVSLASFRGSKPVALVFGSYT
jgi:hypothetical protein